MELLLLVFLIVGISRWASKHDRTLLTKEEYDELWHNSPYAKYDDWHYEHLWRSITAPPKDDDLG